MNRGLLMLPSSIKVVYETLIDVIKKVFPDIFHENLKETFPL